MATNISALTATEITAMPYDVTQNAGSSAVSLWYTYLAQDDDQVLSIIAWSADTAQYHPRITFWQGPAVAPVRTLAWGTGTNSNMVVLNLPVTPGTRYFLAIDDIDATNPPTEDLVLSVISNAQLSRGIPSNALLITDDTEHFPATLVDPVTYRVVGYVPGFPAGEQLASLPNGIIVTEDKDNNVAQMWAYSTTGWSYLRTLDASIYTGGNNATITTNGVDRFYLVKGSVVTAIDQWGVTIDTWTLPSAIVTIAVTSDNTILYYVLLATNDVVRRWDLVNDVTLGAFATYSAGVWFYFSYDMFLLPDGSLVTAWESLGATHAVRYSAAGAIIRDIDLDAL